MMNRQNLIIVLVVMFITNVAVSYYVSNQPMEENLQERSENNETQRKADHELVKQLLQKISDVQRQINVQNHSKNTDVLKNNSSISDMKIAKLMIDVDFLSDKMDDLTKKTVTSLQDNKSLYNSFVDQVIAVPMTMELRETTVKKEIENLTNSYENALFEGVEDPKWSIEIEEKIGNLIDASKLGENIQLQTTECHSKLCKVSLSHPDTSSISENELFSTLGNVSTYMIEKESGISGMKEFIIYISREGEGLPDVSMLN